MTITLIPDYKISDALSQENRNEFIHDENRLILNNAELTSWIIKKINDRNIHDKKIQLCKIFMNPKTLRYPLYRDGKEVYNTRNTVVVHYSVLKGDWDEYDI